jgi:hypothetical protein
LPIGDKNPYPGIKVAFLLMNSKKNNHRRFIMAKIIDLDQVKAGALQEGEVPDAICTPGDVGVDSPCAVLDNVCEGQDQWCGIDLACKYGPDAPCGIDGACA